jgi:hypothetical protein
MMYLQREMESSIVQINSQEDWHFYEELVEMIGHLGEELLESVVLEEIGAVWGTILDWSTKVGPEMQIETPNIRDYHP